MHLFLLRHGAVQPPRPGMYYGGTEVPLSELGRAEALRAAQALVDEPFIAIYSSPLSRARFGAKCLAAGRSLKIEEIDDFREIDRGHWVGLTPAELEQRYPGEWAAHQADPADWRGHGGESLGDLRDRVWRRWQAIERSYFAQAEGAHENTKLAVVSHLFPTRAMLAQAMGLALTAWSQLEIPTASISQIEIAAPGDYRVRRIGWKPQG